MAIETKTPGVMKYLRLLRKFIIANGLKPEMDYSKHPVYGKEYRDLLFSLQKERDKLQKIYPLTDLKGLKKYIKMKKEKKAKKAAQLKAAEAEVKAAKASKKAAKVEKTEKEPKVVKKEKKAASTRVMKYDYPLVNGKEMTPLEKKKYRIEQRKLANGGKPKAEKNAKSSKKAKKEEVSKKETAKVEKKAKSSKKAKKEED